MISPETTVPHVKAAPFDSPDLLERARSGDGESFCALCHPYEDRLLRHAFVLCRNEALAEDLAQETWIQAWKSFRLYKGQCRFFTWVCSILLHRHRSLLRRKKLTISFWMGGFRSDQASSVHDAVDEHPTPEESAVRTERACHLFTFLQQLPTRQREVVVLRFYADESLEGIAAALGCSIGTVKSRLFYGLENLRRMRGIRDEL